MKTKILFIVLIVSIIGGLTSIVAHSVPVRPVILIPGITGSISMNILFSSTFFGGWGPTPLDNTFTEVIKGLEDKGYERDKNLFVAFYDWRKPNASSSQNYLMPMIDMALQASGSDTVDIIAHSMGGLVARSYIQGNDYRYDVENLIMIGTPNHGTGDVYSLWEGGDVPDNWDDDQKILLNAYLWYLTVVTKNTTDFYDTIHAYIPSVQELLPTYDYLIDNQSSSTISVLSMQEQNNFLHELNIDPTGALLEKNVDVTNIMGESQSTVGMIPVEESADPKLWSDGIPDPNPPARNSTLGDNRVLVSSATLPPDDFGPPEPPVLLYNIQPWWMRLLHYIIPSAIAQFFPSFGELTQHTLSGTHTALPTLALPEVFDALDLTDPPTPPLPVVPDEILSIMLASPIDGILKDPNGNIISSTTATIALAEYVAQTDPLGVKMMLIPNPIAGEYILELFGLGNGEYHLGIGHANDISSDIETVTGIATPGMHVAYTIQYTGGHAEDPTTVSEVVDLTQPDMTALERTLELYDAVEGYLDTHHAPRHAYINLLSPLNSAITFLTRLEQSDPDDIKNTILASQTLNTMRIFVSAVQQYERYRVLDDEFAAFLRDEAREIVSLLNQK
jgi:pimeloyl-ACP methyl ester carboxylesterase